jgi:hypothetical protein
MHAVTRRVKNDYKQLYFRNIQHKICELATSD